MLRFLCLNVNAFEYCSCTKSQLKSLCYYLANYLNVYIYISSFIIIADYLFHFYFM